MDIDVEKRDGAVVVELTGEIVSRTEQATISELISNTLAEGERTIILDLSGVPYISSLGIAVLVTTCVKVDREGGELRLVNPRPRVSKVLEMTKVTDIFKAYTSVEEAVAAQ